jgi:hypothetical protein
MKKLELRSAAVSPRPDAGGIGRIYSQNWAGNLFFFADFVGYTNMPTLSENFSEKTFLGANPRIAVIHMIGTPAVVARLIVVSTLVSTCFWKCASSYHK